nr:hydroxyacid dehydrogenase [Candidatus Njordarchaeum guaymaensis]
MKSTVSILITDPISKAATARLKDEGFEVTVNELDPAGLLNTVKDFDVLIVRSRTKVTAEVIQAGTKLKVIARAGVGLDNIDVNAAKNRNITVINAAEAPSVSVAELVFGLMLSLARSISTADAAMKEGKWLKHTLTGFELRGRRLGIVGFGRIGREVAKRALSFEMKVSTYDVASSSYAGAKEMGAETVATSRKGFEELLKTSDIITIHVPLLPETRNMFGEREFALMKKSAIIINASRGGIVDESALLKALKEGKLGGAGLDVFETEPPKNLDLMKFQNVVSTPHIGAQTTEAQDLAGDIISTKIIDIFKKRVASRR